MSGTSLLSKMELRVVMKFLWLQKKEAPVILKEIVQTLKQEAIQNRTVYKWIERFNNGDFNCEDRPREGGPKNYSVADQVIVQLKIDPYQSSRSIAEALNTNKTAVSNTLREELNMRKNNFKWIPHNLTDKQKKIELTGPEKCYKCSIKCDIHPQ